MRLANGVCGALLLMLGTHVFAAAPACSAIAVNPGTLIAGNTYDAYSLALTTSGGSGAAAFGISSGILPTGISLDNAGMLSGTPTQGGDFEITATVTDSNGCTGGRTYVLSIATSNHAPGFTKGADQNVLEDATAQTVNAWATGIQDNDGNVQTLNFIVSNDNNALFSVQPSIAANGTLSFTPALNANGAATITVQLHDNGGTANGGSDTSLAQTFAINVAAVNDAPSFVKGADQTVLEDATAQTVTGWATVISAGPADESAQTLNFIASNNNNALFSSAPAIAADGTLSYTPAANANGTALVTVQLHDNGGTANGGVDTSPAQTFNINVTAVNHAPSFVVGANQTVLEDASAQTIAGWATGITDGDGNTQTLNFIVGNNNAALFATPPAIAADGTLTYLLAPNANGVALVSVQLHDNGGAANGGIDTSPVQTFNINVTAVNDAPTFTKGADQNVSEDAAAQNVANWATSITSGPTDEAGQALNFIVSNNNNALFSVAPTIDASGNLSYTLAANANGSAIVSVQLHDNGGTANGGVDTSPTQTFAINVTPVNDAPSFIAGANQNVLEDIGPQSISNWATSIVAGPANESGQTLNFIVSNNNGALFSIAPSIAANGTLTYTLAANANGSAIVSVQLHDNGGTANGGVDTSPVQTFNINVTAVNDPPSFVKGADQTVLEDAGAQTVTNWATALSAGPADESGQALNFIVGNNNNALFSSQPTIAANGSLSYTPAANANGTAIVSVQVHDNGGTANGGIDTSTTQTFNINVTAVNDVPGFVKGANQTVNDNAGAQTIVGWATAISAGPANEAGQTVNFVISGNTQPTLFSVAPAVAANGTLTYTPATAPTGTTTATISLHIHDNGGTANSGIDTSADQSFTIAVTHVVPPPVKTDDAYAATGNVSIAANAAAGVLANDIVNGGTIDHFGPSTGSETVAGSAGTSSGGGTLTVQNDGSFSYNPPRGFTGSDTFKYHLSNGSGSVVGNVTITVSDRVWFVNNTAGACSATCDGRLSNPYTTLAAFVTANNNVAPNPRNGDIVFVYSGTGTYGGGITPLNGQKLTGQGVSLASALTAYGTTLAPLSSAPPAAGTKPTVAAPVTMVANSRVEGLSISATGATQGLIASGVSGLTVGAIAGSNVSVSAGAASAVKLTNVDNSNFTFRSISAVSPVNGIDLSGLNATAGSFSVVGDGTNTNNGSGGSITGATGNAINLINVRSANFTAMTVSGAIYNNVSIETTGNGVYLSTAAANASAAAVSVTRSNMTGNQSHEIYAHVFGSGSTSVTAQNNTFNDTGNVGGLPLVTLFYDGAGNGVYPNTSNRYVVSNNTATVTGNFFSVNVASITTPHQQTVSGKSDNNVLTGTPATGQASALSFSIADNLSSQLVLQANGNTFTNDGGSLININKGSGTDFIEATLLNNSASAPTANVGATVILNFCPASNSCGGDMRVHAAGNNIPGFEATPRSFRIRQLQPNGLGVRAFEGFTGSDSTALTTFLTATNTGVNGVQYSSAVPVPFYTGVAAGTVLLPP